MYSPNLQNMYSMAVQRSKRQKPQPSVNAPQAQTPNPTPTLNIGPGEQVFPQVQSMIGSPSNTQAQDYFGRDNLQAHRDLREKHRLPSGVAGSQNWGMDSSRFMDKDYGNAAQKLREDQQAARVGMTGDAYRNEAKKYANAAMKRFNPTFF